MVKRMPDEVGSEEQGTKYVVVVYDTSAAREQAVQFCHELSRQREGFEIAWCSLDFLNDAEASRSAAGKASEAEVVVFALDSGGDLPDELKFWLESWLARRKEREGALVGLLNRSSRCAIASLKEVYLRHAAHRAGMDYLSQARRTPVRAMPDSLDSFSERAGCMTSVLDDILHTSVLPEPPR